MALNKGRTAAAAAIGLHHRPLPMVKTRQTVLIFFSFLLLTTVTICFSYCVLARAVFVYPTERRGQSGLLLEILLFGSEIERALHYVITS